jgi:prepilin-type N-terminal cleavage/methylation domain-containing protein
VTKDVNPWRRPEAGFTLIDVMLTLSVLGIIAAMAVPGISDVTSGLRLGQGAREVERELQTARLLAVTSNRPIRVRFNCPAAGQYRIVEVIGSATVPAAADSASDRCDESAYPYPAADRNVLTVPNHDGPIRRLPKDVAFGAAPSFEFLPDGTARQQSGSTVPWPAVPTTGATVTLAYLSRTRTVSVNRLGKITLVQQ